MTTTEDTTASTADHGDDAPDAVGDRPDVDELEALGSHERRELLRRLRGENGDRNHATDNLEHAHPDEPADYPTSYPQQRLWFMQQLSPLTRAYHVESVTPIEGPFDSAALERALSAAVARHAVLRTIFREVDGEPRQIVQPSIEVPLARVDLSTFPMSDRVARTEELLTQWSHEPFDLEAGPLVRSVLVRLAPTSHLLALYMHHIVADGWSMGIFGRELDALYRQEVEGRPAELPALPVQYTDFAVWQRRRLSGRYLDEQLDFWRETLADLATLDLPTDRPRPPVEGHEGGHVDLELSRELRDGLTRLGAEEGATLFMTLLAAYAVLLSRWSGESDLPIGTYLANRRRPELEPLVGFFLNTLVLRVNVDRDATFRELVREAKQVALDAYDHQDVPFELIVEAVAPPRDLSRNPLFQVVFQLNNQPTQDPHANTVEAARARRDAATFDLGLMMFETADGLGGQFEFATDLFDESTVRALAEQFEVLLGAAVEYPDVPVIDVPVMRSDAADAVLSAPNQTGCAYQWETGVIDLFLRQVAAHPDSIAFGNDLRSVTFAELDIASNRVAHALIAHGVERGDNVAIQVERSVAVPAAVLGVVKAGAAWVPLDDGWPEERRAALCAAAGVRKVLAQPGTVAPDGASLVDLQAASTTGPEHDPGIRPGPGDPAYVLGTSGSTGVPKAVIAPHGQILNRLHWMWDAYPWGPGERASLKTTLSFVDSVWELFGGLLRGVPTWVVPPGLVADVHGFVDSLRRGGVTRLWLVPSLLRSMLDEFPDLGAQLPALRFWVASGEDLPLDLLRRFTAAAPDAKLFNLYGTTEIWDATWCDPAGVDLRGRVPIGRPISNVRVYVLDDRDRPVPFGWPGQLHVAGAGLGLGYCDPNLDRRGFRTIDLAPGRSERLYATGDRVVLRRDLQVEFIGRDDGQLKVRGVRVERAEVEAALASHPSVAMCVVGLVDDGAPDLIAWYEPIGDPPSARTLRTHLAAVLAPGMIPSRFIAVESLPRTSSGKVDRRQLPAPDANTDRPSTSEPPVGPLEQTVAAIWSQLLAGVAVGRDDDFFADLGGHSLLGARAMSRLRDEHDIDLPLRWLFEHPTVRTLVETIESRPADSTASAGPIPRLDRNSFGGQPTP